LINDRTKQKINTDHTRFDRFGTDYQAFSVVLRAVVDHVAIVGMLWIGVSALAPVSRRYLGLRTRLGWSGPSALKTAALDFSRVFA